jgi:uncharacterized protein YbaP (TraB family)
MMRWLVVLCALLVSAPAWADSSETAAAQISPALYVARDADSTLYLFGTVHVRRPGAPWGGADARAALESADEIWTEMEMSQEAQARAQQAVLVLGAAPAERPLSSWLDAEESERLTQVTGRLGVPRAYLETMQPWLAAITLSMAPMLQAGYDPMSGVDRAIDAAGAAAGKRMRAFETAEQQLRFMSDLPAPVQRQMLLEAIEESEAGPGELDLLTGAWEEGDVDAIERVVIDEMRTQYPELYQVLFVRRNAAWAEVLMDELDGAGIDFVAVGTGHLLGDDGLVALLRAQGVSVERVGAD